MGSRALPGKNAAPKGTYDIAVSLSTGVPITGLACASHKINVEQPVDSSARIALGIRPIMAGTGISYSAGSWPDRR